MKIAQIGFLVSFLGSIAPGIITLGIVNIGLRDGLMAALAFSLGAIIVEAFFVWVSLPGLSWFFKQKKWYNFLNWVSLTVMVMLTIGAGFALFSPKNTSSNVLFLPYGMLPIGAGMLVRILTPTFIPFWLGWNAALFSQGMLNHTKTRNWISVGKIYVLSLALGSFAAHLFFIALGALGKQLTHEIQSGVNWFIFIALTASTIFQLNKIANPRRVVS
jgi:threonine/homoserine/homoserine lactone efflux protein